MLRFLARRAAGSALLALLALCGGYLLVSAALDPLARFRGLHPPVPDAAIAAALDATGTNPNTPGLARLATWLWGLVHGSLGTSVRGEPVGAEIAARVGTSVQLLLLGTLLGVGLGVVIGVVGAVRQHRWFDRVTSQGAFIVLATPPVVVAVLGMLAATRFNQAVGRPVIRFTGQYTAGYEGWWDATLDRGSHLLLPTLTLTIVVAAFFSRYQRAAMADVLGSDLVRGARATGRTYRSAVIRRGVRLALVPTSTYAVYTIGTVLAGATMIELVFSWHGMGEYLLLAVSDGDINAAAGTIALTAVVVLGLGLVADLLHAWLDPRVRL